MEPGEQTAIEDMGNDTMCKEYISNAREGDIDAVMESILVSPITAIRCTVLLTVNR